MTIIFISVPWIGKSKCQNSAQCLMSGWILESTAPEAWASCYERLTTPSTWHLPVFFPPYWFYFLLNILLSKIICLIIKKEEGLTLLLLLFFFYWNVLGQNPLRHLVWILAIVLLFTDNGWEENLGKYTDIFTFSTYKKAGRDTGREGPRERDGIRFPWDTQSGEIPPRILF